MAIQTPPLDIRNIPRTQSLSVSLLTHTLTHRQTLVWDQVCARGGSLLSLLGPQLPPAFQMAMVSAPHLFAHMALPTYFHLPTPPAPCNKVRNYKSSERCLVLKSPLALIWHDYSWGFSGTASPTSKVHGGGKLWEEVKTPIKSNIFVATSFFTLEIVAVYYRLQITVRWIRKWSWMTWNM